ncbi:transcription elongation factor A protein 1-like [Sminthopsis crassicaudata]|uniref:transcription elongation factor A protein 1-like n=1 Tax=Sminthopsis crassicaudata TaxID=9301 RepID=UPI003D69D8FD
MVQNKNMAGALDLLKELQDVPMTLELLRSTKIGISVNTVRKQSTDEEVTSLAKSLVTRWKKSISGPSKIEETKKGTCSLFPMSKAKEETKASDSFIKAFPRAPSTSGSVPIKCRELLAAALRTGGDYFAIGADVEELGAQIEEAVYQELRNRDMKYQNRLRRRTANLKDAKNPSLRKNVLCGNIPPDSFARMTAVEMASEELKEMRRNLTKEAIRIHQMARTDGNQTDLFRCGKCTKKNGT